MSIENEVWLGFAGLERIEKVLEDLGVEAPERALWDSDSLSHRQQAMTRVREQLQRLDVQKNIRKAQLSALEEIGLQDVEEDDDDGNLIVAKSFDTEIHLDYWNLELHCDLEMKDGSEQLVLGVPLTCTCFGANAERPVFLDWNNSDGGLRPVVFDQKTRGYLKVARKYLKRAFPVIRHATIVVKETHH